MINTQIQLTEEQSRWLKARAAEQKVAVAEIVRQAIDRMAEATPQASSDERRRRALEAAGSISSGRSDVSARHDEYLAEAWDS